MSELLWRLHSRRLLADSFCQCEAKQNMEHFKSKMLSDSIFYEQGREHAAWADAPVLFAVPAALFTFGAVSAYVYRA